jgi:hypothetical protein
MERQYLHLNYPTTQETGWILRIQSKLGKSRSKVLKSNLASWKNRGLGEAALVLATRSTVLKQIVLKINTELGDLQQELLQREKDVTEAIRGGHAIDVGDRPFKLVMLLDAFLFELKAASEFTRDFIILFFNVIFDEVVRPADLKKRFLENNIETAWLQTLKNERDALIHGGGMWPTIQIGTGSPPEFILVLERTISHTKIENTDQVIPFEFFRELFDSFRESIDGIEEWLIREIETFETSEI